jgi:hypothetical protein
MVHRYARKKREQYDRQRYYHDGDSRDGQTGVAYKIYETGIDNACKCYEFSSGIHLILARGYIGRSRDR